MAKAIRSLKDEEIAKLKSKIRKLQTELRDYKHTFDLQSGRMTLAIETWRNSPEGDPNVIPDLGKLLDWFIGKYKEYLKLKSEKDAKEEAINVHTTEDESVA